MNVGHYELYDLVDSKFKKVLAGYYREGIEQCIRMGEKNPYHIGVPFIWCSNNLTVALVTQILLYERMTGDLRYHAFMSAQRDWLLGRNPWVRRCSAAFRKAVFIRGTCICRPQS